MTHEQLIQNHLIEILPAFHGKNNYGQQHYTSWTRGVPIAKLVQGLALYADEYRDEFGSEHLSDDAVMGEAWFDAVKAVRTLLSGPVHGLYSGAVDSLLMKMIELEGFNQDEL